MNKFKFNIYDKVQFKVHQDSNDKSEWVIVGRAHYEGCGGGENNFYWLVNDKNMCKDVLEFLIEKSQDNTDIT